MGRARYRFCSTAAEIAARAPRLQPPQRRTSALPLWHHAAVPLTLPFDLIERVRIGIFVET